MRLDIFLTINRYYATRTKAIIAIKNGSVIVNGKVTNKQGFDIKQEDIVTIKDDALDFNKPFGYFKIKSANDFFNIDIKNKCCLDIGCSTGGFSLYFLDQKCKNVIGVEKGRSQIDKSIVLIYKNFTNYEMLDFLDYDFKNNVFDVVACDVSFTSIKPIIDKIAINIKNKCDFIFLIKPQFEVEEKITKKYNGIISDKKIIKNIVDDIINYCLKNNLKFINKFISIKKFNNGNDEYFIHMRNW